MDLLSTESARWIFAAWFLFLGGAVGSFLNVVVYRLPAGMSISWPGSHCPNCKHAIRRVRQHSRAGLALAAGTLPRLPPADFASLSAGRSRHGRVVPARCWSWRCSTPDSNLPVRIPHVLPQAHRYPPAQALCDLPAPSGPALHAPGRRADQLGRQTAAARAVRPAAVGGPRRAADLALAASPAGRSGESRRKVPGAARSIACWAWQSAVFLGRLAQWLGRRFAVMGKPGSQILGEALVIGVVLGWQAVLVLVPLALLLEELSRIAALRWTSVRRFVAAVWIAPLTLFWILNWARLATWLRLG